MLCAIICLYRVNDVYFKSRVRLGLECRMHVLWLVSCQNQFDFGRKLEEGEFGFGLVDVIAGSATVGWIEVMTMRAFGLRSLFPAFCYGLGQQSCAVSVNVVYWVSVVICAFEILTKWFSSTRLETRTKESNIYASIWVENPYAK